MIKRGEDFIPFSKSYFGKMREFETTHILGYDGCLSCFLEKGFVIVVSTQGFGYMGIPGVKYEAVFSKSSNLFLFSVLEGSSYDICLYKELLPIKDYCFDINVLFANVFNNNNKNCYVFLKYLVLEVSQQDYSLSILSNVTNFNNYFSYKSFFLNCFCFKFLNSYHSYFLSFIYISIYYFINPNNYVTPYCLSDSFLDRKDKTSLSLHNFYNNNGFYLNYFYFSTNFFTHYNSFLNSKIKYKTLQRNRGGYVDFEGLKILQFNFRSSFCKVLYFLSGGL